MKIWGLWFLSEQDRSALPLLFPQDSASSSSPSPCRGQSSHLPLPWFLAFYSGSSEVEKMMMIIISQVRSAFFFLKWRIVQMRCPLSPPPLVLSLPILLPSLIRPLLLTFSVATSMWWSTCWARSFLDYSRIAKVDKQLPIPSRSLPGQTVIQCKCSGVRQIRARGQQGLS